MEYYCYLRNIQDLLSDGRTPNEWRFGESSNSSWFVGMNTTPLLLSTSSDSSNSGAQYFLEQSSSMYGAKS